MNDVHSIIYTTYCFYCLQPYNSTRIRSVDHIYPRSRGGKNNKLNKLFCCRSCNHEKSNKTPAEFIEYIEDQLHKHRLNVHALPSLRTKLKQAFIARNYTIGGEYLVRPVLRKPDKIVVKDGKRLYYDHTGTVRRAELIEYFP